MNYLDDHLYEYIILVLIYYLMYGFAIRQGEGEEINFRGTKMLIKVSGDDSEGRYSLIEMIHPANVLFKFIQLYQKLVMYLKEAI